MKLVPELILEQQQKLLMTPELRQAIAILQMSTQELTEYLQQELEANPVLELRDETETPDIDAKPEENNETEETEWLEYFVDRSDLGYSQKIDLEGRSPYENYLTTAPTLDEHLTFQLHLALNDELQLSIGSFLIGSIDDSGYLQISVTDAARELDAEESRVEEVLKVIQGFEPYGVGARDLGECLLIQLGQSGRLTPAIERVINEFLNDLARGSFTRIASALGINVREVQEIADLIKSLDPKPGRQYGSGDEARYLIPDITVEKMNNEYIVLLNDYVSPRLTISSLYQDMIKHPDSYSKEAEKYLEERINSAVWLVKSIEHRRLTLYKVARCIVDIQRDFLDQGVKCLKPLNLRKVAEIVGVHESTISRATANKYIQTPQGVYELKYFFSSGVESAANEDGLSSRSIKKTIKDMINDEDPKNPLSDQQICEILHNRGIQISRRTVAKYRGELGISSTSTRKRY
ncbi:MAG: RNA polymerase factor sigma-54 [Acidobacteriota bacterium]